MPALTLLPPINKILVVGHLSNKIDKLQQLSKIAINYDYVVFNSGLMSLNQDIDQMINNLHEMKNFIKQFPSVYLIGRNDYLVLTKTNNIELEKWVKESYNAVIVDFSSRSVIIIDGGIHQQISNRTNLSNNLEVSFISKINNKSWHESYNGSLGFIISNNPLTQEYPKYYQHSMQLGNINNIYAVEVDDIGLKITFKI